MLSRIRHWFRRKAERILVVQQPLHVELTSREKLEIDEWMKNPVTVKVLSLMEAKHPGRNLSRGLTISKGERDDIAAVNFLNQVYGWELFRNQLLNLTKSLRVVRDVTETFPTQ